MSERRATGAIGVLVVAAALLVAVAVLALDWTGEKREFVAAVPQPSPLVETTVVPILPGRTICLHGATIVPEADVAAVRVGTRRRAGVPLTATLAAPGGYRSSDRIDGTWQDNDLLRFDVDPPSRPVHGRFCLRNDGRRVVDVYAADDRSKTLAVTRVDGRRVKPNIQLVFLEAERASLRERADRIAEQVSVFRAGVVAPPVVWALFVAVLLGLPLGLGWAMWNAVRRGQGPAAGPLTDADGGHAERGRGVGRAGGLRVEDPQGDPR